MFISYTPVKIHVMSSKKATHDKIHVMSLKKVIHVYATSKKKATRKKVTRKRICFLARLEAAAMTLFVRDKKVRIIINTMSI